MPLEGHLQACMDHHAARRPTNGSWASLRGDGERLVFGDARLLWLDKSFGARAGGREEGGEVVSVLCARFYACLCQISILLGNYSGAYILRTCINLIPLNGRIICNIYHWVISRWKPKSLILYSPLLYLYYILSLYRQIINYMLAVYIFFFSIFFYLDNQQNPHTCVKIHAHLREYFYAIVCFHSLMFKQGFISPRSMSIIVRVSKRLVAINIAQWIEKFPKRYELVCSGTMAHLWDSQLYSPDFGEWRR